MTAPVVGRINKCKKAEIQYKIPNIMEAIMFDVFTASLNQLNACLNQVLLQHHRDNRAQASTYIHGHKQQRPSEITQPLDVCHNSGICPCRETPQDNRQPVWNMFNTQSTRIQIS